MAAASDAAKATNPAPIETNPATQPAYASYAKMATITRSIQLKFIYIYMIQQTSKCFILEVTYHTYADSHPFCFPCGTRDNTLPLHTPGSSYSSGQFRGRQE